MIVFISLNLNSLSNGICINVLFFGNMHIKFDFSQYACLCKIFISEMLVQTLTVGSNKMSCYFYVIPHVIMCINLQ